MYCRALKSLDSQSYSAKQCVCGFIHKFVLLDAAHSPCLAYWNLNDKNIILFVRNQVFLKIKSNFY
jgi:hypothetical protein